MPLSPRIKSVRRVKCPENHISIQLWLHINRRTNEINEWQIEMQLKADEKKNSLFRISWVALALGQQRQSYRCPTDFCYFFLSISSIFRPKKNNYLCCAWSPQKTSQQPPLFPNLAKRIKLGKLISVIGYYSCVCVRIAPTTIHRHHLPLLLLLRVLQDDEED